MAYVIAIDAGSGSVKTGLVELGGTLHIRAESAAELALYPVPGNGMEQDAGQWWDALCRTVRAVMAESGAAPEEIAGIAVCAQMLGVVLVDRSGVPVRRPMNYLDGRAGAQRRQGLDHGLRVGHFNVRKVAASLLHTRIAPLDVGDPLWKYKWVEACEPENFARVCKWLDVKDYLNLCLTGRMACTRDTAFTTMLYEDRRGFSQRLMALYGVEPSHMPQVLRATDVVGGLTAQAAEALGLVPGIPVFGGGGDASCIPLGAGSAALGMTHVYIGTSGWVSTVCQNRPLDPLSMIASLCGAQEGRYNYHAEMNTAGKAWDWLCDCVAAAPDCAPGACSRDARNRTIDERILHVGAGSGGVLFVPWLSGERCPVSVDGPGGAFAGLSLETGRDKLLRAAAEGICYHVNWMLERHGRLVPTSPVLRFVGGGARSPAFCRILADVTGKTVESTLYPRSAGILGAAVIAAVGLDVIPDFDAAHSFVPVGAVCRPDPATHRLYRRYFAVYKKLCAANRRISGQLQRITKAI